VTVQNEHENIVRCGGSLKLSESVALVSKGPQTAGKLSNGLDQRAVCRLGAALTD
jgi:hypothetical protein